MNLINAITDMLFNKNLATRSIVNSLKSNDSKKIVATIRVCLFYINPLIAD